MLVPVIFTLKDPQADNGFVYLAERLVEPLVFARIGDRLFVTGKLWPKLFEIRLRNAGETTSVSH